jgi:hypothetical protein
MLMQGDAGCCVRKSLKPLGIADFELNVLYSLGKVCTLSKTADL